MTNKTVLTEGKIARIGARIDVCHEPSKFRVEFARAIEQDLLQSPEIQQALADSKRIDWLADPDNHIGNVQLPIEVVESNLHSLRDAIDAAMEQKP